jgi:4-hydroxythreonine-4-phosphate dehydrogenase
MLNFATKRIKMGEQSTENKIRVGITVGDLNGISHEILFKVFADHSMYQICVPVFYGNAKAWAFHKKLCGNPDVVYQIIPPGGQLTDKKINLINCWEEEVKIEPGPANSFTGKYALISLNRALKDLKDGFIDVLVTLPLDKNSVSINEPGFTGHTGYIAAYFKAEKPLMVMVSDALKVACVTVHVPLKNVPSVLNTELIKKTISACIQTLKNDFMITKPRIAVLGLNPHAGDEGLLGNEERDIIQPAINSFREEAIVLGPYPADGFFGKGIFKRFDLTLAMYHDQGLIPFKTMHPDDGVNFTAGLPVIRTSPAHGTGADIAGKNKADESSFRSAIYRAIDIFKCRKQNAEARANPLKISELSIDRSG